MGTSDHASVTIRGYKQCRQTDKQIRQIANQPDGQIIETPNTDSVINILYLSGVAVVAGAVKVINAILISVVNIVGYF
ncbi:Hypothetical predicted protein [Octopus vulgaris]|uniref:Uncharacterized protein n=1 Tax=Octopus vulgaris TaxID=6645 RepID=A0AA36F4U0_OCTVU|nr:Hypothetical predicted protein [Octopus vulgaris]